MEKIIKIHSNIIKKIIKQFFLKFNIYELSSTYILCVTDAYIIEY